MVRNDLFYSNVVRCPVKLVCFEKRLLFKVKNIFKYKHILYRLTLLKYCRDFCYSWQFKYCNDLSNSSITKYLTYNGYWWWQTTCKWRWKWKLGRRKWWVLLLLFFVFCYSLFWIIWLCNRGNILTNNSWLNFIDVVVTQANFPCQANKAKSWKFSNFVLFPAIFNRMTQIRVLTKHCISFHSVKSWSHSWSPSI